MQVDCICVYKLKDISVIFYECMHVWDYVSLAL